MFPPVLLAAALAPAILNPTHRAVFVSDRDGNPDLYMLAKGVVTRLTDHPAVDRLPAWSPECSTIAFESERDGTRRIWLMDDSGANARRLTRSSSRERYPAFSPNGTRIALAVYGESGTADLFHFDREGGAPLRLTADEFEDAYPAWSPFGDRIAFHTYRHGKAEIYAIGSDGSNLTRLTENDAGDYEAAWSPDGSAIAFVYRLRPGETRLELFAEYPSFINGIAASDDGAQLFLGDYRGVQVMDVATRLSRPVSVPDGESLAGTDGLYVRGRTLVAIQNGRRNQPERLLQAACGSAR